MTPFDSDGQGTPGGLLYSLQGATKTYGSGSLVVRALDDIELEIREGEFVVIAGPSGSGKSTMLQLLGALDRPSGGSIEFEGQDLGRLGDKQLAELRLKTLGFIFQQFNLIPTLTAEENVELAMAPLAISADQRSTTAQEMLGRVDLGDRAGHLPSQLSGGEQQRVAIARALANHPDVLLADEPTGNLDSKTGQKILELLHQLWAEAGLTVVLITHDQGIAEQAPRVIRLADGQIESDERQTNELPTLVRSES
ncbi:MAG: ABC transporter ATP-binding protein [Solirubrobacterales bacterium]